MNSCTSDPAADPTGRLPASLRDTLAASFAAALFLKDKGWSSHPGSSNIREAYRMADQFLAARPVK